MTTPTLAAAPLSVDDLLAEQRRLGAGAAADPAAEETAVEIFARVHEQSPDAQRETLPDQHAYYQALLPASPPRPGEQYAFEVDLDACSGCKACVVACHSLNGLDDDEAWRDVGLLHTPPEADPPGLPVLQHVTTACHHCLDPGCLRGCPVNAYEKDPATGIVRHLDDQCFGCQYCTLMCPYEVPKYHAGHGIVRKCDMCSGRLAAGEAPACVQACPHEAIRIRTVSATGMRAAAAKAAVSNVDSPFALPHTPPVQQTIPTTIYKTDRLDLASLEPADIRTPKPSHAHGPLTVMLALTQLGVGGLIAAATLWLLGTAAMAPPVRLVTLAGFGLLNVGLAAATLHLGRPHLAFRAVLGWRHSWLSREAIAFGAFMPLAAASVAVAWLDLGLPQWLAGAVFVAAAVAGLGAVFTSVMIYVAARKPLWGLAATSARFALTALVGASGLATIAAATADGTESAAAAGVSWGSSLAMLAICTVLKLAFDARALTIRPDDLENDVRRHSARLLRGPLRPLVLARLGIAAAGLALAATGSLPLVVVGVALIFVGELLERWLFFVACVGPKMPGGLPR